MNLRKDIVLDIQNRHIIHPNFTLTKLFKFGIASGIGAIVVAGGTYVLTEYMGIYYVVSTVITGVVAFSIKFVINAVWTFKK